MDDLDQLVRRVDEDRWLASRFAPPDVRARLTAIYAVNYEIARTAEMVREPALGAIRLQWWREAIAEIFDGAPLRAHPALLALKPAVQQAPLSHARFEMMIAARTRDFEAAPFPTWVALTDYVAATAGALMRLSVEACGVEIGSGPIEAFAADAGWRWGLAGILRSEAFWRGRGRYLMPNDAPRETWIDAERAGRARSHDLSRALPASIFPAVGYVALVPAYLRRSGVRAEAPLLERQLRLIAASATGRF